MATLKDVARLANVDVSTVSRALNNTSYVHPDTKKKIMDAVQQLSYKPNLLAKGLRQGKRRTIGVVVPSLNLSVFGDIVQSVEKMARDLGYAVMICTTQDDPDTEEECLNRLRNGLVDGILIASTGQNKRLLRSIHADGIAVAQMVRRQDNQISSAVADYFSSAFQGVKFLYKKGSRHIGLINGSTEIIPYRERYRGYKKAVRDCRCEENTVESSLPKGDYFKDGYEGARALLRQCPETDGILVAVDMQGLGALRALKDRGIKVPKQVRVLSLTGNSIGTKLETTMSSLEMPAEEIGRKVTQMIIEEIEASPDSKPSQQHIVFDVQIAERETT